MGYEQRYPTSGETEAVHQFFSEQWGKQHFLSRNPDFLNWQFAGQNNPQAKPGGLSAITVWDGNMVVGMQGVIRTDFVLNGEELSCGWLCNLMAHQDYRYGGVGFQLLMSVKDIGTNLIATSGINPKLYPYYKKMKYLVQDNLPRYVKILDRSKFTSLDKIVEIASPEGPDKLQFEPCKIQKVERFDGQWDEFFSRLISQGYCGVKKDSTFLNWRYVDHPVFDYHCFTSVNEAGRITGAVIFREEDARGADVRFVRLIECFYADNSTGQDLLTMLSDWSEQRNASVLDFYNSASSFQPLFEEQGWLSDKSHNEIMSKIPSLLQPYVEQPHIISTAFKDLRVKPESDQLSIDKIYWSKGDGDQDRPN